MSLHYLGNHEPRKVCHWWPPHNYVMTQVVYTRVQRVVTMRCNFVLSKRPRRRCSVTMISRKVTSVALAMHLRHQLSGSSSKEWNGRVVALLSCTVAHQRLGFKSCGGQRWKTFTILYVYLVFKWASFVPVRIK